MTKKLRGIYAYAFPFFVSARDNKNGWKTDDAGNIIARDGNPVWVDSNGAEMTLERDTVSRLNAEAKAHREAKEAAETRLKAFEGLDASKAREALETVKNIDLKKMIDSGKLEEVRKELTTQFQTQIAEKDKAYADLRTEYDNTRISNIFAGSEFIRTRVAVPADMFEATFKGNFKIEDGKIVVKDKAGNQLMSKKKIGEYADPDEALELLIEQHPQKDVILKANGQSGSGNRGNGGNGGGGNGKTMKRSEYDGLSDHERASYAQSLAKRELTIVDG